MQPTRIALPFSPGCLALLLLLTTPTAAAAPARTTARRSPSPAVDPAWLEFLDQDVIVSTKTGAAFVGHVLGIERGGLTLRLSSDTTRMIVLDDIAEIKPRKSRVPPPPPVPEGPAPAAVDAGVGSGGREDSPSSEPSSGRAMLITGSVILAVGAVDVAVGAGVWFSDTCSYDNSYYTGDYWVFDYGESPGCLAGGITAFSVGIAHVVVGSALLAVGARRLKRWKAWKTGHLALRPALRRMDRAWGVGLDLRF